MEKKISNKLLQRVNAEQTDLFSAIFNYAHDGIVGIDEEYNILLFNHGAERIFGYTVDEVIGKQIDILLPLDLISIHHEHVDHFAKSDVVSKTMDERKEISGRRKDGSLFPGEASVAKTIIDGKMIFTVILRDISRRKAEQKRSLHLNNLLNRVGEMAKVGGWEVDAETMQVIWTDEVARIHELDLNESINVDQGVNYFIGESKEIISRAVERAFQFGEEYDLVLELLTAKGNKKWVQTIGKPVTENGKVIRLEGSFQDITKQKHMEDQRIVQKKRGDALARTASRLNAELDLTSVLQAICEETAQALNVPIVSLTLLDKMENVLYNAASVGLSAEIATAFVPWSREHTEKLFLENHNTIIINDSQMLPEENPNLDLYKLLNLRTVIGILLYHQDKLVGGLNIITVGETREFTDGELTLLRALADQAAPAIVNAQLFEKAQQHIKNMEALHNIDISIANSFDVRLTLKIVIDAVITQLEVDAADILLYKPITNMLEFAAGQGFRTSYMQKGSLRLGQGIAGRAALDQQRVYIPNLPEVKETFLRTPLYSGENFMSYYAMPLVAKGQIKGVLEIFHRSKLNFDDEWVNFFETIAGQAAIAIDSTQVFEGLQRANLNLSLAYDTTIEGWSRAMDLRDKETEGHTQRVTELTLQMSRAMGMSEEEILHARRGALLHDMGKLGIPDNILFKAGKLTDEEWIIMRKHPQFAYDMLHSIEYLRPALDIPYCHHEKWDGTGYPRGLKGEQIPMVARIFAVVDVWDALRSDRPYREGWPEEKIFKHIRSLVGTHFDPKAVELFFKVMNQKL